MPEVLPPDPTLEELAASLTGGALAKALGKEKQGQIKPGYPADLYFFLLHIIMTIQILRNFSSEVNCLTVLCVVCKVNCCQQMKSEDMKKNRYKGGVVFLSRNSNARVVSKKLEEVREGFFCGYSKST